MECQSSDSKKLYKVFDASKRKRTRKKRDGLDDTNSVATDDSASVFQPNGGRVTSTKVSLQDITTGQTMEGQDTKVAKSRDTDTSPSVTRSPVDIHRSSRSPRRHRRPPRDGLSLALKAGMVSTPRSISPTQDAEGVTEPIPQDQDSFIYAFLEEAIKRDKKKHRHSRRREERRGSREREASAARDHRHHHHRRRTDGSREHDKPTKDTASPPTIDQAVIFETFAKLCSQLNEKPPQYSNAQPKDPMPRTLSHKSLQCEVVTRRAPYEVDKHPVRLRSQERSREIVASKIRSQENCSGRGRNRDTPTEDRPKQDKCICCYDKNDPKYSSKLDVSRSRNVVEERYREYPPVNVPTRSCIDHYRNRPPDAREYRDYDRQTDRRHYEDEKRKYCEQKTSRSFDVHREPYPEDDRGCRRTARSDTVKERRYEDKRYDDGKYYDDKADPRNRDTKDKRWRRNVERCDRNSVVSRDDEYNRDRERDRYSERERDSGLSVADGETSTMSGRSNCLKVVKQEIAEQREAMDKMMKLWKELMRCFKGISQTHVQDKAAVHDSAANVKESAAAQLRLWRECMRRYETVARDVGDTDARLMEEIKKQRSEMAEMSGMWQECLQRYRDMSTDFNNLKQKLATSESPTRLPAHAAPLACAEGEGSAPPAPYRLPHHYPLHIGGPAAAAYAAGCASGAGGGGGGAGSPLRTRASAPPAWWWCDQARSPRSPRRRSSPESRASRDRDRRHRHKDRDESRYKEKSSKPNAARSEHRHRKR